MQGRVLVIAGSDSGGGAGIQADIKTITMLGGYAATAITALTAQNTFGVQGVMPVPPEFIKSQIEVVLTDIGADVIKTGMLHDAETIAVVMDVLDELNWQGKLVVDPVMVATSGDPLLQDSALEQLKILIKRADIVTPNIPEAEILTGQKISDPHRMEDVAKTLLGAGTKNIVLKGGHLDGNEVADLLLSNNHKVWIKNPKFDTKHTHGTGCTLASAIAALLSKGDVVNDAFMGACRFVRSAIERAPGFGAGHGPLGHMHAKID